MQSAQAPQGQAQGGGITDVLVDVDGKLFQIANSIAKGGAPQEVAALFQQSLQSYRAGLEALMSMTEGGQAPQQGTGPVTPEQGGGDAIPMQPGGAR